MAKKMTSLEAVMVIECEENASKKRQVAAWQTLIDSGDCWIFQGFYGRTANRLIEEGLCHPANGE